MKGGQQQQGSGNSMDILWISAILVLGPVWLWYAQKQAIVQLVYNMKLFELKLVTQVMTLLSHFDLPLAAPTMRLTQAYAALNQLVATQPDFDHVAEVYDLVGYFYSIPCAIFGVLLIVYVLFVSRANRFKTTFDMKKLRQQEKENWPYILPILQKNLIETELDEGPFAMSKQPLQFAYEHDLVIKDMSGGTPKFLLKEEEAFACFSRQLGNHWTGRLDCLPNYAQALFAIFAARGNDDMAGSTKLLNQIARSSASGQLNFGGTNALIAKHIRSRAVGRAVGAHAYTVTAMASMLELARTAGVLAMAEILWLKRVDRSLWYMLSSVGRQTPFIEASAAYAHWIVEKRLRRPLKVPMVHEAVVGLRQSLEDTKYNPDRD